MTEPLFAGYPDPDPLPPEPTLSADRRRTLRQKADVAAGRHPLRRLLPIVDNGHTCGDCGHLVHRNLGGSYLKCDLTSMSRSAASDARAWWPACPDWTETTT